MNDISTRLDYIKTIDDFEQRKQHIADIYNYVLNHFDQIKRIYNNENFLRIVSSKAREIIDCESYDDMIQLKHICRTIIEKVNIAVPGAGIVGE
jgi:hypothetical protein